MITTRPDVCPDGLYNQKQVAEALQIDRHTVARYEANGCIKFKARKAGNGKVATGAEVIRCWQGVYLNK